MKMLPSAAAEGERWRKSILNEISTEMGLRLYSREM